MKTIVPLATVLGVGWLAIAVASGQDRVQRDRTDRRVRTHAVAVKVNATQTNHLVTAAAEAACRRDCQDSVEQMFHGCVETGGEPMECEEQAGAEFWLCLQDVCGLELPASPCEYQCHLRSGFAYAACIDARGTPEECGPQGQQMFSDCLWSECSQEPQPPQCGSLCHQAALDVFNACMDAGGDEETCYAEARDAFEACVATTCGGGPLGPSCESVCRHQAEQVYNDCLDTGELPEVCADLAREALRTCLVDVCGHEFPLGDVCVHDCHVAAEDLFHACRQDGGTRDECAAEAVAFIEGCLLDCP